MAGIERRIEAIAIFCGSNFGGNADYADGARRLGRTLAEAGITIVYGGTHKGLMGCVADAALEAGGRLHGVITQRLHDRGHAHPRLEQIEIMPTLRARKERMAALADAFIALPGGIGTLEEFLEVWTMNQLAEIDKPAGLLDTRGFFAPLLSFIDHMVEERFLPPAHRHSIVVDADPSTLLAGIRTFERVDVPKWL
ncbi:LOG family protein [Terrihabitans sp. B22-R8]|uniref:LOG family protein n=1 Tax=Terrihabitans sp. B22-R8 TaxID=3425128 RepID=UPI00403CCFBA